MTPASWLATEFMFLCSLACDALSPVGCCTDGLCEVELAFFGMAAAVGCSSRNRSLKRAEQQKPNRLAVRPRSRGCSRAS